LLCSTSYCVKNPQWGQENIRVGAFGSLFIVLPYIDFIKITSSLEITAKFFPSPIESHI